MDHYLVEMKEFVCLVDFVIVNMDLEDPLVPIVCFNFILIKIFFYFILLKTKAVTKKDIGLVLMEGHAVQM